IISGFMFPIFTMPAFFQWVSYLNPIRHFLEIVRPVFLKGYGVLELWPSYLWLVGIAAAMLAAARWRFRTD
ncbi:MAG TPA: ABC transporter permease, partial [Longimicrobiales bacterium]|nr:ABC transporter permease [Longimicrobiales bacterium]